MALKNNFTDTFSIVILLLICLSCDTNSDDNDLNEDIATNFTVIEEIPEVFLDQSILRDVPYGDHEQQVYDIYLPEGRSSNHTKTILLVHGGSWTGGDKVNMNRYVSSIQETHPEYAIVNLNYVLAQPPVIPAFPNQFLDIELAVQTLKENSQSLGITEEFGLIGSSAGAHIAMMYDYQYDTDDDVKFVANIVGPSDFTDPNYIDVDIEATIGDYVDEAIYPENTNFVELFSPTFWVSSDSSPTLLFYGNQDPLVPLSNAQTLEFLLSNSSVPNIFTVYDGGHGNWDDASYIDLQLKIGFYIDQYLPINN